MLVNMVCNTTNIWVRYPTTRGHAVAQFVEALRCKLEGREFDSNWRY